MALDGIHDLFALVVYGRIKAQLVNDISTFLVAAGDADDVGAFLLGDLAHQRANSPRGGRHQHRLTVF